MAASTGTGVIKLLSVPQGVVAWLETEHGVRRSCLPRADAEAALAALDLKGVAAREVSPADDATAAALAAYYSGERADLSDVPLDPDPATPFTAAVRAAVQAIPPGVTLTYGTVAEQVGSPGAARAVGQTMARNPLAPFVPCHRVVAVNGWGGFGGGINLKQQLLAMERDCGAPELAEVPA